MEQETHRVLIVDDLPDWRTTLSGVLTDARYQVEAAGSAPEALELLAQHPFDAAVIDIRLDDADEGNEEGLTLAGSIKERWPSIRIVIITGYSTPDNLQRACEPDQQGVRLVDDYVLKNKAEDLVPVLERVLR